MVPKPTPIYHITAIDNVEAILRDGGLYANSVMQANGLAYTNIAYDSIQDRRRKKRVPVKPFGTLHDYVPFYFAPRSPMLYTINQGNVPGYSGQKSIVHFVSTIEAVDGLKPWVFTDGHGIMSYTSYYNDLNDLNEIDWDVMNSKIWNDTSEFPDRLRRRQAEFLVYKFFPLNLIQGIGVFNSNIADKVRTIFSNECGYNIPIGVRSQWYY